MSEPTEYEYGFVLYPGVVIWSLFGGIVGMKDYESARHAAVKSADEIVIVRRPKGTIEYEEVEA